LGTIAGGLSFVETRVFTRRITSLGLEDALRDLQLLLLKVPDAGDLDPGTSGLRKRSTLSPAEKRQLRLAVEAIRREWRSRE
jgi:hypothetical protein